MSKRFNNKIILFVVLFLTLFLVQTLIASATPKQFPDDVDFKSNAFITNVGEIDIYEGIAFVSGSYASLDTRLYDIRKPQWPQTITENPFSEEFHKFAFNGDKIYSICTEYFHNTTLKIHSFTENRKFELLGEFETKFQSEEIVISGNKLCLLEYLRNGNYTIGVYDVSNSSNIIRLGQSQNITGLSYYNQMGIYEDLVFLKHNGFEIYNISNPSVIVKVGVINNPIIGDNLIKDDILYCVHNSSSISLFDISDIINPVLINTYEVNEQIRNIELNNNILYAKLDLDLIILDLADMFNPQLVSRTKLRSWSNELIFWNDYLFSEDVLDLQVIDVHNIDNPKILPNMPRLLGYTLTSIIVFLSIISFILITINYLRNRNRRAKIAIQTLEYPEEINQKMIKLEKVLKIASIIFVAENIIQIFSLIPVIIIFYTLNSTVGIIFNVIVNIPLILDLCCGLVFAIVLFMLYLDNKRSNYLFSSISWIAWIVFSIFYRVMFGFPNLYSIIDGSLFPYPYLGSIFFALSLFSFWLAIFLLNIDNIRPLIKNYGILYSFSNWIIGIVLVFGLLLLTESVGPEELIVEVFITFIYFMKIILVPIIGVFYFLDFRKKIIEKHLLGN